MRKRKPKFDLTISLYIIFLLWTIFVVITLIKKLDSPFIGPFIIGYVIFILLFALYFLIKFIRTVAKLSASELVRRIPKFFKLLLIICIINLILNELFFTSEFNWIDFTLKNTLFALMMTFIDLFIKLED